MKKSQFLDDMAARMAVVERAREWIGTPFAMRGTDRDGVDCTMIVVKVYWEACELYMQASPDELFLKNRVMPLELMRIGDLAFFRKKLKARRHLRLAKHVGIYVGNGRVVHASGSMQVVCEEGIATICERDDYELITEKDFDAIAAWAALYFERTQGRKELAA